MSISVRTSSDEQLLRDSDVEVFRGPGPGGQKRNKTSSAVRITHRPTGVQAIAGESRSQSQNRAMALRRLRIRLALVVREPVDLATFQAPPWFSLDVSDRNEIYPLVVGVVIDLFEASGWSTSLVRQVLNVGSRPLTRFLHSEPLVWARVQKERSIRSLKPLTYDE